MEYEDKQEDTGFFDRVKESPRTVSALIIILIVAAAIYAFSGDKQQPEEVAIDDTAATEEQSTPATDTTEEQAEGAEEEEVVVEEVATTTPVTPEDLSKQNEALPQAEKTNEGYQEVTATGEGITHLARKATTRYLAENNAGYTVTNEHRIYIEDYVQNRLGSQSLEVGQTMTVSFSLLQEATASAGQLNQTQLNNLSHYTSALG